MTKCKANLFSPQGIHHYNDFKLIAFWQGEMNRAILRAISKILAELGHQFPIMSNPKDITNPAIPRNQLPNQQVHDHWNHFEYCCLFYYWYRCWSHCLCCYLSHYWCYCLFNCSCCYLFHCQCYCLFMRFEDIEFDKIQLIMADEGSEFAAAPRVVKPKNKYKEKQPEKIEEDEIKLIYNNLMWDKRVVRGNTYSALVTTSKNAQIPYANTSAQRVKPMMAMEPEEEEEIGGRRANIQIFTDEYVETLTDKPPRYEYGAQTQFITEKEVIRHRMPQKIGQDMFIFPQFRETQIWDNQLFDFDYQVQPLLSVLCARTLEISRMQVLQEQQLATMRNRQLQLHLEEEQEEKKIKQMYNREDQLEKENMKRLENYRKQRQKKVHTHQRLFSRVLAKQYLRDLKRNTEQFVEGQGFFRNQIEHQLVHQFLPTLYSNSLEEQGEIDKWKQQAEELLKVVHQDLVKQHKFSREVEKTRRDRIIAKRQELAREKGERKMMKEEEKYMKKFLQEQKIQLQKEEEERRAQEEAEQQAD